MIDERILAHVPGMDGATPVQSIAAAGLSAREFRKSFVDPNIPTLIKGALDHWPAIERWRDKEYLRSKVGDNNVSLYRHLNYSNGATMKKSAIPQRFTTALDVLHGSQDEIIFVPFRVDGAGSKYAVLKGDTPGMPFVPAPKQPLYYPRSRVFMYRGAGSGWHSHRLDETLMCQIVGVKRVALLPTNDGTYEPLKSIFYNDEYLDDARRFDGLRERIRPIVADVCAGDALYIPPNWWHGVQPLHHDFGATLTYCWRSPLHKISDLSYPAIRDLWRETYKRPNPAMLVLPFWGVASFVAQAAYSIRRVLRREPMQARAA